MRHAVTNASAFARRRSPSYEALSTYSARASVSVEWLRRVAMKRHAGIRTARKGKVYSFAAGMTRARVWSNASVQPHKRQMLHSAVDGLS